jgi:hypothetical protein
MCFFELAGRENFLFRTGGRVKRNHPSQPNNSRRTEAKVPEKNNSSDSDAEFLGWQKTSTGGAFALYNVKAEQHPLFQSTVSAKTLRRENLEVPPTPHREETVRRTDHEE